MKNKGYEIELKWAEQRNKDFRYSIGFNMAYARNEIMEMDEIPPTEPYMSRIGTQVGARFGYVSDGFYKQEDFVLDNNGEIDLSSGKPMLVSGVDPVVNVYPGDIKYVDQNGDNLINSNDVREIGNPKRPLYNFGLNFNVEYKGFFVGATLAGVTGTDLLLEGAYRFADNRNFFMYQLDEAWTPETAATATLPRLSFGSEANNYRRASEVWLRDGSYLKLKNASIGYNLKDKRILKSIGANSLSFKLTGYNLLTFDYIDIIDPEGNPSDADKYPIMRNVTFAVNLTF